MLINTDYLVVGAGASGLAFVDALVAEADVEVTMIDRRRAPGGHWRSRTRSSVCTAPRRTTGSTRCRSARTASTGSARTPATTNGRRARRSASYFAEAASRLTRTGRVRILTGHEYLGRGLTASGFET